MSTTYDRFDKAREQYISYNLGYQIFAAMWANPTASSAVDLNKIKDALKHFYTALQFNQNDVDSKKRVNQICDKWGPGGDGIDVPPFSTTDTQTILDAQKAAARTVYKECKC